jgi:hypothetical protein
LNSREACITEKFTMDYKIIHHKDRRKKSYTFAYKNRHIMGLWTSNDRK